jgi:hypothetical protein
MTVMAVIDVPTVPPQSMSPSELRAEQTLAALPSAVSAARRFVRHTLAEWQIDTDCAIRIESAARELVTHSVATTGVDSAAPLYSDDYNRLQLLVVRLRLASGLLSVEVWDRTEHPPRPQLQETAAVRAVDEYNYATPRAGRRVVWCSARATPLPRRVPRPVRPPLIAAPDRLPTAEPTVDLLRRVLDGLHQDTPDPP